MIKQLHRAHYLFLLHHDVTLETLYQRIGRAPFCARLDRFWRKFAWNWDVLLNGNPAVEVYDGIKLSAGGELGIGVGEEEWGSGEREVLEDFVSRTDGLVDLVVSRFGEPSMDAGLSPWLGSGVYPRPSDGIIFSGVGAISRESLVRVSHWIEWIYTYGDSAYGASEDPTAPRRRKQKRRQRGRLPVRGSPGSSQPDQSLPPGIPRPLVVGTPQRAQSAERKDSPQPSDNNSPARSEQSNDRSGLRPDVFMKYLTLGYGSWLTGTPSSHPRVSALKDDAESSDTREDSGESTVEQSKPNVQQIGKFVVGLRDDNDREASAQSPEGIPEGSPSRQVDRRILHVRLTSTTETKELQAIVYAVSTYLQPPTTSEKPPYLTKQNQPFIFTFLFDPQTPSPADPSLYQSISHQLLPLQKPLSKSTSPTTAAARIATDETTTTTTVPPVYDLIYDPTSLTIRSSIPNIPDLAAPTATPDTTSMQQPWPRIECINIHHQLMGTYIDTRARPREIERTSKTSRGWWIVWVRMASTDAATDLAAESNANNDKEEVRSTTSASVQSSSPQEAFLVRKSTDSYASSSTTAPNSNSPGKIHSRGLSTGSAAVSFFRDLGGAPMASSAAGGGQGSGGGSSSAELDTGPGRLVEGLGIDARRYLERLMGLNR